MIELHWDAKRQVTIAHYGGTTLEISEESLDEGLLDFWFRPGNTHMSNKTCYLEMPYTEAAWLDFQLHATHSRVNLDKVLDHLVNLLEEIQ